MKTKYILLTLFTIICGSSWLYANPDESGKAIFLSRCAACHNVNKVLTGPALAGVHERHSMDWIVRFVNSSQALVRSGDKDAITLFQQFNKITMPDHPDLTPVDIKNIIDYIKTETVVVDNAAPFAKPGRLMTLYRPLSLEKDYWYFVGYGFVVLLLVVVLLFGVRTSELK